NALQEVRDRDREAFAGPRLRLGAVSTDGLPTREVQRRMSNLVAVLGSQAGTEGAANLRPAEGASEAAPGRPPIARATVTNSTTSSLRLWTMYNVGRGRRVSPPTLARRWSFVIQAAGEPARSPKTLLLV